MIAQQQCGLSASTQEGLCHLFQRYPQIKKVVLYGSRAKGNYKPGSDIDLTVFSDTMTLSELLELENAIDDLNLPYKVDLSLFHHIDNSSMEDHIIRVGVLFYEKAGQRIG